MRLCFWAKPFSQLTLRFTAPALISVFAVSAPPTIMAQTMSQTNMAKGLMLDQGAGSCDFSKWIGQCKAAHSSRPGGGIYLLTDTLNCAMVDYQANGRLRRIFVTQGRGEDQTASQDIKVTACQQYAYINQQYAYIKPLAPVKPMQAPAPPMHTGWSNQGQTTMLPIASQTHTLAPVILNPQFPTVIQTSPDPAPIVDPVQIAPPPVQVVTQAPQASSGMAPASIHGDWCDVTGARKLSVGTQSVVIAQRNNKHFSAPFVQRLDDGLVYAKRGVLVTHRGKIGLAADTSELIWENLTGFTKVSYLRPCA